MPSISSGGAHALKKKKSFVLFARKSSTQTLSDKLDVAEEEWHKAQPKEELKEQWQTKETGTFGQDGWSISTSYKPLIPDD